MSRLHCLLRVLIALSINAIFAFSAQANPKVLRVVPHANLSVLDPSYSMGYITRNHGFLVFDTLFGMDTKHKIHAQMVESWTVSPDQKIWTFKLRPGLKFHDGAPVTADDVIASLKRWSAKDFAIGPTLAEFLAGYEAPAPDTFRINLKEPIGFMLDALGKVGAPVPFIMPKRLAETPLTQPIKEIIGSGPYIFKADEFRAGDRSVYLKNPHYIGRTEPANGLAGNKTGKIDRIEWLFIRDTLTQFNALRNGEVDLIETVPGEQVGSYRAAGVNLIEFVPNGLQYIYRVNPLHPPFDNPAIRQAALLALGQEEFMKVQVGTPGLYRFCKSIYVCGGQYESDTPGNFTGTADPKKAAEALRKTGYKGETVVVLRPGDIPVIAKLGVVGKQQLERAGFKVELQTLDSGAFFSRLFKKEAPAQGGWNAIFGASVTEERLNPLLIGTLLTNGENPTAGWFKDELMLELRTKYARATQASERKKLAHAMQARMFETGIFAPLGQVSIMAAMGKGVRGFNLTPGASVFWTVEKD